MLHDTRAHDLFAIVKEADAYKHWGPFVDSSSIIHEYSKTEMLLHFRLHIPLLLSRDALLHVYTCDHAETDPILKALAR
ncbi:Hypothetical protein NocV09_10000030, partial [Nannochloropsis oceanica]